MNAVFDTTFAGPLKVRLLARQGGDHRLLEVFFTPRETNAGWVKGEAYVCHAHDVFTSVRPNGYGFHYKGRPDFSALPTVMRWADAVPLV